MPDHLHLVVEGKAHDSDCRRFSVRARQYSAFYYRRQFGEALWQPRALESVLRDREQAFKVARYILENPIRAGLAPTIAEYLSRIAGYPRSELPIDTIFAPCLTTDRCSLRCWRSSAMQRAA